MSVALAAMNPSKFGGAVYLEKCMKNSTSTLRQLDMCHTLSLRDHSIHQPNHVFYSDVRWLLVALLHGQQFLAAPSFHDLPFVLVWGGREEVLLVPLTHSIEWTGLVAHQFPIADLVSITHTHVFRVRAPSTRGA